MEKFIILLVMFVTFIGPLLIMIGVFSIPVILLFRKGSGEKLSKKTIFISIGVVFGLPIIAELISVVTLIILYQIYG